MSTLEASTVAAITAEASPRDAADVELSVVVLSWNTRELLRACLTALANDGYEAPREVIVVDNGSSDGSAQMVARDFPQVRLVANAENLLYAYANNQGARCARGRYLCLLNSDTEVRVGALARLVAFLETHAGHAAVAPRLVHTNGTVQRACRRIPTWIDPLLESTTLGEWPPGSWFTARARMADFDHATSRDVEQPPGACIVMRRAEFLELGGLDESLSLFFNDVDLCRTLRKCGRGVHYLAEAEVLHHEGASTRGHAADARNLLWTRNRLAYYRKNHGPAGAAWLHVVLSITAFEGRWRIRLGARSRAAKRLALEELAAYVKACRAP